VTIIQFTDAGKKIGSVQVPQVHKTDAEWKQQLTPLQFEVTRQQGTERAFTGQYYDCTTRTLPLHLLRQRTLQFRHEVRLRHGMAQLLGANCQRNIRTSTDSSLGMTRDEVSCTECGAHLGHVFDDGLRHRLALLHEFRVLEIHQAKLEPGFDIASRAVVILT